MPGSVLKLLYRIAIRGKHVVNETHPKVFQETQVPGSKRPHTQTREFMRLTAQTDRVTENRL